MSSRRDILHVGIDLGTSRSAISASNGEHHMVDSYVGWPVDLVARKLLKKNILIGGEAVEKRTMLDLHRPLERGLIKEGSERDEEAVRELLRHLLALAKIPSEDGEDAKTYVVVGVPAGALRVNKQHVREVMRGLTDGLMIVSEPFAVAYGAEALLHSMIIDIGAGTTDFCVMKGRYPSEEDQRTLSFAGDAIDAQLAAMLREHYPEAQFSDYMVRSWKEQWGFIGQPKSKRNIMVTVPIHGKPTELNITDEMRMACENLVPPVVETMLDLLSRVEPEFQEGVRQNMVLAGGCSLLYGLADSLEQALEDVGGGKVRVVPDPAYAGAEGGLAIALDALDSDWDKLSV
jgi:rod shape-determining protein MreB